MSKQLTRLKDCNLIKVSKESTDDGDFTEELSNVGVYSIITQELTDAVSATIYGSNISKMVRISSVHRLLEILLKSKVNNTEDKPNVIVSYEVKLVLFLAANIALSLIFNLPV